MKIHGKHFQTNVSVEIAVEKGLIQSVTQSFASPSSTNLIAPAYFDLQINGGQGVHLTSSQLKSSEIRSCVESCHARGIAAFCPTVISESSNTMLHSLHALASACQADPDLARAMPCFHLEGPYISKEDGPRGAHPREHVREPDWGEFQHFQEAADGRIKLVTLAPELPGALPFIELLTKADIVVSIGHTAGPPALIRDAVKAGARMSTHLGNGCARMLHRHDNVLWEQLAADELHASIIPDGHHLPWTLVKCILRSKTADRMIITCDASPLAGQSPGKYSLWGSEVEVLPEGKIVLSSQDLLAGSWSYTHECVTNTARYLDLPYAQVHPLACENPRKLLGLPVPLFEAGQPADLLLLRSTLEGRLELQESIINGRSYSAPATTAPADAAARSVDSCAIPQN